MDLTGLKRMHRRGTALLLAVVLCALTSTTSANVNGASSRTLMYLLSDLSMTGHRYGAPMLMRVFKLESELEVWLRDGPRYRLFKRYPVCMYSGSLGPKLREGDRQSPEGFYHVTADDLRPRSQYHRALDLGYPNPYDRLHGRTGGLLMIHGNCVSRGCYAMTDSYMEEIYALASAALEHGQDSIQVQAYPFRMTDERLARYHDAQWYSFWMNLKEGYDYFERHRSEPTVRIEGLRYAFESPH